MSASSILSRLRHKGQITEAEYRKLMDIKNSERHMRKVCEEIRAEIEETIESYVCDIEENTMKAQGMLNAMRMTFEIIEKHIGTEKESCE